MIGYVTLGTNDLARAAAFYDEIAKILGHSRMFETERMVAWGTPEKTAMMGVITPLDEQPASAGNGSMFGLPVEREEQVHQIYDHAMANGGSDEGPPGPRGEQFYAAYFRDPDGNKLLAYLMRG
jgi:catechol 2,3-dioxygenase-like lactoylglutathione lyase family enzyme